MNGKRQTETPPEGHQTLRLAAEELTVSKESVETGRVRVTAETRVRSQQINTELLTKRVDITTVPIGRRIDAIPPVRQEGDVTIVSIVEEVLVVERHLMLKEELRIRNVHTTDRFTDNVELRYQHAVVHRSGYRDDAAPSS